MPPDPPGDTAGGARPEPGSAIIRVRSERWQREAVESAAKHSHVLIKHDVSPQNRRIIVFVHGALGHRLKTWGAFPELVFEAPELSQFDIALFGFSTGRLAHGLPSSAPLDLRARAHDLADLVRTNLIDQELYDRIAFVTHGLGGVLAKLCIRSLVDADKNAAHKLHSLFLYGAARFGARDSTSSSKLFSADLRALRAAGDALDDLNAFWYANITHDPNSPGGSHTYLDLRNVVSAQDSGPDRAVAIRGLPPGHVKRVPATHENLTRPEGEHDPRFRYFRDEMIQIEKRWGGTLVSVLAPGSFDDGPKWTPDYKIDDAATEQLLTRAFESGYVVDLGSAAGVREGDVFRIPFDRGLFTDESGHAVDPVSRYKGLLVARSVDRDSCRCDLKEFQYREHQDFERSLPVKGNDVVRLAGESWLHVEPMEHWLKQANDRTASVEARRDAHVRLLIECSDFLEHHSNSFFAELALWHRARSSLALGRHEEAIHAYTVFERRFPFTAKRRGVNEFVTEVTLRRAVAASHGQDPAAKARLGLYLTKSPQKPHRAEGVRLIAEVALENSEHLKSINRDQVKFVAGVYAKRISGWDNDRVRELLYQRYDTDRTARAELAALCNSSDERNEDKVVLGSLLRVLDE